MKIKNLLGFSTTLIGFAMLIFSKLLNLQSLSFLGILFLFVGVNIFLYLKWNALSLFDKRIALVIDVFVFVIFIVSLMNNAYLNDLSIIGLFLLFGYVYFKHVYKAKGLEKTPN